MDSALSVANEVQPPPQTPPKSPSPLEFPGAPRKGIKEKDDTPPDSPRCVLSPCVRDLILDPSMRECYTPPQSQCGSPTCPNAPRAPHHEGWSFGKAYEAALKALEKEAEESK